MILDEVLESIRDEYVRASTKHPPFCNPYEGCAVMDKEFEEFKRAVFSKPHGSYSLEMQTEAKHVGAMAVKFLILMLAQGGTK